RHAAIAQAVKLRQPAGLEARGNDDGIAAALHQVRELLVIADDSADTTAMAGSGRQQRAFQCRIARAEDGEPDTGGNRLVEDRVQDVHSLLPGEAADDAEDGAA